MRVVDFDASCQIFCFSKWQSSGKRKSAVVGIDDE